MPRRRLDEPCSPAPARRIVGFDERDVATIRALADAARLELVARIAAADEPVCFCDLTPHSGLAPSTVSHHLKILKDAGVVYAEKRGRWVYYAVDRTVLERHAALASALAARGPSALRVVARVGARR